MTFHPFVLPASLLVVALSLVAFVWKRARYRTWHRVSGVVTELIRRDTHTGDRQDYTLSPRVSFEKADGETVEFVSSFSTFPAPKVEGRVAVIYNPDYPGQAMIDRFVFRHLPELVLGMLGLALAAASFWSRR